MEIAEGFDVGSTAHESKSFGDIIAVYYTSQQLRL
jgi:hypothetical protein